MVIEMTKERLHKIDIDADAFRILNERKEMIKTKNTDMRTSYSSVIRELHRSAEMEHSRGASTKTRIETR